MFRCPVCSTRLEITDAIQLTARQRDIRDAIDELKRSSRRGTASTQAIAVHVGWSVPTVKNELHHLEHLRIVSRPGGKRSGWSLRRDDLVLVRAA